MATSWHGGCTADLCSSPDQEARRTIAVTALGSFLTDPELLAILRAYADAEHRRWQPLWERKAGGARVRPTGVRVADGVTLEDTFTDHRSAEDSALHCEFEDERARRVLRGLKPAETAAATAYATGAGTWADAAQAVGNTDQFGERVRRKLKRLGDRHTVRAAAMTVAR